MKVNDNQIECVWKCQDCGEETSVTPDWYEDNGTPVCAECGDDMAYDHTQYKPLNTIQEQFWKVWESVLSDDQGVSEDTYAALFDLAETIDPERLAKERLKVDATDGRFYIPSDDGE